jgi:hypothetical protein
VSRRPPDPGYQPNHEAPLYRPVIVNLKFAGERVGSFAIYSGRPRAIVSGNSSGWPARGWRHLRRNPQGAN